MKKLIFALLSIFLLLSSCAVPQAGTNIQPTPTSQALSTEQLQVAQTSSPTATSTTEIVAPTMPTAGERLSFESLDLIDPNTGWGIDILGHIFHTANGGDTWTFASPPDGVYTSSGFFALDGNTAWAAKDVPVRCWDYWGIYQCDQPYYAAVKSGTVWKTTDGGQTWQPSKPFSLNIEKAPYSFDGALPFSPGGLQFIDPQTGWLLVAVGQTPAGEQSLLYRTNDGGTTWEMMQTFGFGPDVFPCPKRGFTFSDENNGWLIANCPQEESSPFPMILRTTDGGNTWSPDPQIQEMTLPSELQPVDADGNLTIFESSPADEYFQRYPDGSLGTHLLHYFPKVDAPVLAFLRLGDQVAGNWISGVKFHKARGQQSSGWMTMGSEYFLDTDHGWRLYWDLVTNGRWLQKTVDGGKTWESTKAVAWRTARFEFVDAQTGWAIVTGQAGLPSLVKTVDGGRTWGLLDARVEGGNAPAANAPSTVPAQVLPLTNIAELWMIDTVSGWAVTGDDQLLRTVDGAQTWSNVTPPAEYKAYQDRCYFDIVSIYGGLKPEGFFALDADNAWVAQHGCAPESAAIWKTSDGGRSWRKVPLTVIPPAQHTIMPASFSPISLFFDDAAHGWLAVNLYPDVRSFEEHLFRTQDGGDSWQPVSNESLPCYPTCAGVAFSAPETVWLADDHRQTPAVSDFLSFYYSADGGKTWEEKMLFDTVPSL
ncbi:MAG TPA: hypothetical protein VFQ13_03670, partial [Anaerolineales bacterium]|nr:hypothetical protein [Anaerolineales bacterium]